LEDYPELIARWTDLVAWSTEVIRARE